LWNVDREFAMLRIDEWKPPEWVSLEWDATAPAAGKPPRRPPAAVGAASHELARAICTQLESLRGRSPEAVHFYVGEGLRWIRVGFAGRPLRPEAVAQVGGAIASCIAEAGPLYFHALRPHDILFFVTGGDAAKAGMPVESFGLPLEKVLRAWGLQA
jgi:hypothetical protein